MGIEQKKSGENNSTYKDRKNGFEWAIFAIGLVLVLAIITYLGYKTYTHKPGDPKIYLEYFHDPTEFEPHRYHLVIHNQGSETAEEVKVELILQKTGKELEVADLHIPYCPKESTREGWVAFSKNPALADTIVARVVSYKKP